MSDRFSADDTREPLDAYDTERGAPLDSERYARWLLANQSGDRPGSFSRDESPFPRHSVDHLEEGAVDWGPDTIC